MAYLILNGDDLDKDNGDVQYYEFNPNDHATLRMIEEFLLQRCKCPEERQMKIDEIFDEDVKRASPVFIKKIFPKTFVKIPALLRKSIAGGTKESMDRSLVG